MRKSGFLVRFVDVVLILLFGFISISEIQDQSLITLPKSTQTPETKPENQVVSIFVGITKNGVYLVDGESQQLRGKIALRNYLSNLKKRHGSKSLRVRLRSDFDASIEYTLIAAKLCDDLAIPKSIEVRLKGKRI